MLEAIINFLNLKLGLLNYFEQQHCLCELKSDSEGKVAPVEYVGNANYTVISHDEFDGVSYWRLRDKPTQDVLETKYQAGKRVEVKIPLRLVFSVRRTKLTTDDAYAFDRIRQTIVKQFNFDDGVLKTTLGAESVVVSVPTSNGDPKEVWDEETSETGTYEPNYSFVYGSIDIEVAVIYKGSCLPTECDDVDPNILHAFDFCKPSVFAQFTPEQVTCLEGELCEPLCEQLAAILPEDVVADVFDCLTLAAQTELLDSECVIPPCAGVTQQVNGTTIGTTASGGTNNQVIVNTAGTPQGTSANPSVIANTTIRNSATPTWTDAVVSGVTKTLSQAKALDSDGATTLLADYIPAADGFMFTCTPASYGTRILSVLKRQYCIEAEAAFSLRCLSDEFLSSALIRVRRSGDNAERDTLESEITDGTLTAWVISGGGTQEGFVVKYYDHTGNGYVLWVTTAGQQDRIVNAGVLVIDSGGKPAAEVMSSTANFRYTRRADGTTVPLGLVGGAGSMWLVAKRGVAALTYMLDRGGNPAIGVAMVNASTPSSGSGSPAYTVNSVALSPNTRTQLKTVTEGIETATIVNDISWASGNWYAGQSAVANQFPVGSLISECVIFNKDASVQQAYIQTNLDNYYAY